MRNTTTNLLLTAVLVVCGTAVWLLLALSGDIRDLKSPREGEAHMPDPITMSTSWCWLHEEGDPPVEYHTTITVTTTQRMEPPPPEDGASLRERHIKAVTKQEALTPNNCPIHN